MYIRKCISQYICNSYDDKIKYISLFCNWFWFWRLFSFVFCAPILGASTNKIEYRHLDYLQVLRNHDFLSLICVFHRGISHVSFM